MTLPIFKLFDKESWYSLNEGTALSTEMKNTNKRSNNGTIEKETGEKGMLKEEKLAEEKFALNDTSHRIFVLSVLAIVLSSFAISFSIFKVSEVNFGGVDMGKLLRKKAAALVSEKAQKEQKGQDKSDPVDFSPQLEIEARLIRSTIERYAAVNKVIVVVKGAVIGGNVKEVTDEIETLL